MKNKPNFVLVLLANFLRRTFMPDTATEITTRRIRRSWLVAVPSYQRAKTLAAKTLAYLSTTDVPLERVTVFVASAEEEAEYRRGIGPTYNIVVGRLGMRGARNFIQEHYPEGQEIFCLDDDLEALYQRQNEKRMDRLTDLSRFLDMAFAMSEKTKLRLWGIYPVGNPFFMKQTVTSDLRYIVGCAWGCRNARDASLAVTMDDKEDFERTIKFYLADGGVLRFNHIAPRTRYYKEPGGMQVERTVRRVQESAALLAKRYPELCTLDKSKDHWELKLKDRRSR